jgi:hypothetical protein
MEKLADALRQGGIDVSSLALLFETAQEKVHELIVPGMEAIDLWRRLRARTEQTGHWPVLLGGDDRVKHLQESVRWMTAMKTEMIRKDAATIDPAEWFENRYLDEIDELKHAAIEADSPKKELYWSGLLTADDSFRWLPQGPWPEGTSVARRFSIPIDPVTQEPLPRVHVALLPTVHGWQAPAFLRFGAWGKCPSPGENAALMKYWGDRHGAEVVGIAGNVVELRVLSPPRDRDAALALAREQYLYCQDIVTQGVQTLQRLAATLLDGGVWSFWWD